MNYLIGRDRNNGDCSGEIVCSATGTGDDQVNVKLEGNWCWDGGAGSGHICWLFAHGYTAAVARGEMCFHSKPRRRPPAFQQQMQ